MKYLLIAFIAMLPLAGTAQAADLEGVEAAEVRKSGIRVNVDGTGVITHIDCSYCGFTTVNITEETAAWVANKRMSPAEAVRKAKSPIAYTRFDLATQTALEIRFGN